MVRLLGEGHDPIKIWSSRNESMIKKPYSSEKSKQIGEAGFRFQPFVCRSCLRIPDAP